MTNYSQSHAANELLRRRKARGSFSAFLDYLALDQAPARHHQLLNDTLQKVADGEIKRLMVFMPPGSAKSTYGSTLFPAWYLGNKEKAAVIAASHTSELAERFGRRTRNIVDGAAFNACFGYGLSADSQAAGRWETSKGGEYFAVGVGGSVTGRRADLGIIDDPVKSREEADSETVREKVWEWYKSDFYTRLKPGASVVLIMTRWHEDDLAGRLLKDAEEGGEQWTILSLPMEAEADDPLGREIGEMLWPEWFTPDMVANAKRDPRNWLALYQQKPRAEAGGEFKREWLQTYRSNVDDVAKVCNKYILVDAANQKRKTSDYTSMWVVGLGQDQNFYVLDMIRDRLNLTERTDRLFALHRKWKPHGVRYEQYGLMADVQHIKDVQERDNYRFPITEVAGQTPKNDRIRRLIPSFEARRWYFPETLHKTDHLGRVRELVEDFIEQELLAFPVGVHDDQMDALARIAEPNLELSWPKPVAPANDEDEELYANAGWMA